MDRLLRERAIALGNTIEPATLRTYNSALTSYLTFICTHNLPTAPSEDTLSFYIIYMPHHISLRSVTTHLSGIVQQLEPFYPLIREIRNSKLVQRSLQGCLKSYSQPPRRKCSLTISNLSNVLQCFENTPTSHDNLLFLSMLFTTLSTVRSGPFRTGVRTEPSLQVLGSVQCEGGPDPYLQVRGPGVSGPDLRVEPGSDLVWTSTMRCKEIANLW